MTTCNALNSNGIVCGKDATNQSYFWYHDPHKRIDRIFNMCQKDSNKIINSLIFKELSYRGIIDKLYKKIESLRHDLNKNTNLTEEREAIRNAKENGVPRPKFKKVETIHAEIKECYRKIKVYKDLLNVERNKTCKHCGFALKEPNDSKDQFGSVYAHADFHSGSGYRREAALFHTECGVTWLLHTVRLIDKEIKYVRPKLTGQGVLFESTKITLQ